MYIPLRVHSSFSMLESTIELGDLVATAVQRGLPAVGLADRANLFGAMAFSTSCMANGVQPVIGTLMPFERQMPAGALRPGQAAEIDHLALYACDAQGWNDLLWLMSQSHLQGVGSIARLRGRSDRLLCLTGGSDGALARLFAEGQDREALGLADELLQLFGDRLFIEISRSGEDIEARSEDALIGLAFDRGCPLVATAPARFLQPSGHEAHDVMLCIADGSYLEATERRHSNPQHYLADAREMAQRFADLPEALENTALVAQRTAFAVPRRAPVLPKLVDDAEAEKRTLRDMAEAGLRQRLQTAGVADAGPYWQRFERELQIIGDMGFAGYFLIVADFIQWSKDHGVPVGPGRGSGAGSLIAWAIRITDLDPLALGLLFERFLNPERKSMPDFDIDFCETRREEVIHYVQEKYGREQVAQIITFGRLKARAVVKDVGRVMQLPYGQVNRIAGLIPNNPADPWDLQRTLKAVPELKAEMRADAKVQHLIDIALQLENRPRHSSTHAAGVVIGDRPLSELVPLYRDPRSDFPVTQFDLKWAEAAGLVKFDFLGLKTLSVLARAVQLLAARGIGIDLDHLPLDDAEVYAMMTRGDTVGVFQFESEGMRRALALVRPTLFEDIIALGALYRPGPMDNIPSFAERKWGREAPDYLHPMLEPILRPTYGVIIYQEQVMQIAQVLAGYSLGEADILRRAMGKKIKSEMDAQRSRFLEGAHANGVDEARANYIFDLVDKFAGYGFNKSHAAAYALVAYQTAWLKCHYPAAFYAASMAYDIHLTDKLAVFVADMQRLGVPLLPPDLNASGADFTLADSEGGDGGDGGEGGIAVRYALGALKGVGEGAMAAVVAARGARGAFASVDDFVTRVDPHLLNRRQVEALAAAGAFDCLGIDRARIFAGAELVLGAAAHAAEARATGQGALFGGDGAVERVALPEVPGWSLGEKLGHEHGAFGFWFSGHPVEAHAAVLATMGVETAAAAMARRAPAGTRLTLSLAALVEAVRWRVPQGKSADRRYMMADLTDQSGAWSASCFNPEAQAQLEAAARAGEPLLLAVELQWRDGDETPRLAVQSATELAGLARNARARLRIELEPQANVADALAALLPRGGRSIVEVRLPLPSGATALVALGRDFLLGAEAIAAIEALPGVVAARLAADHGPALRLVA